MKVMEARNKYGLSAGWKYSNGSPHYSWDVRTPLGTPIHADQPGLVRDLNDGVPNNRPGHNPGSGAASNWLLLHVAYVGGTASIFLNHLSPGLKVKKGQRFQAGAYLANSGNSGNSTGPHLHITTTQGERTAADRFAYLSNPDSVIWQPDKVLNYRPVTNPKPPQPPAQEDDVWSVIFINHKGKRYACYPAAGQKFHIGSPKQEGNIKNITQKAGGRVIEWAPGKDVDDPGAFGVTVQ